MTMTASPRIRSATQRSTPHYECRVVRSVVQDQPELSKALRLLKENTSNFVNYKWNDPGKELGRLGVTLIMLEPVLRQILPASREGAISRAALLDFETELREEMDHAQFADQDIPIYDFGQLALYGKHDQHLGIRLNSRDLRLVGDRAMVEQYIRDNYDRSDGLDVSKRFLARNLKRMEPHITIGTVDYARLEPSDRTALVADPTSFILQSAYERMEQNQNDFGSSFAVERIEFPETVALNGLRVFCQQRT